MIVQLEESSPVFTTPQLDFESHSQELLAIADDLYRLRNRLWRELRDPGMEVHVLLHLRKDRLQAALDKALCRFNVLTKPPAKKKKGECLCLVHFSSVSRTFKDRLV
jgi:hypothetical protein